MTLRVGVARSGSDILFDLALANMVLPDHPHFDFLTLVYLLVLSYVLGLGIIGVGVARFGVARLGVSNTGVVRCSGVFDALQCTSKLCHLSLASVARLVAQVQSVARLASRWFFHRKTNSS